jgi:predicted nuclease of restriction endonuclease-like RecB superfamily
MIKVHGEDGSREDLVRAADQPFEHDLIGVRAGAFADLDNERCLAVEVTANNPIICSRLLML